MRYRFAAVAALAGCLQASAAEGLRVLVVDGANTRNRPGHRTAAPVIVEVRDEANRVVPAARLHFRSPDSGPGVTVDGSRELVAWTDTNGRASIQEFEATREEGDFLIVVDAFAFGRSGSTTLTQSNSKEADLPASSRKKTRSRVLLVAGIAGAAALTAALILTLGGPSAAAIAIDSIAVGSPK